LKGIKDYKTGKDPYKWPGCIPCLNCPKEQQPEVCMYVHGLSDTYMNIIGMIGTYRDGATTREGHEHMNMIEAQVSIQPSQVQQVTPTGTLE
jgi:hypothetical protein